MHTLEITPAYFDERIQRLQAELQFIKGIQRKWRKLPKRDGLLFTAKQQEAQFLEHAYSSLKQFRQRQKECSMGPQARAA